MLEKTQDKPKSVTSESSSALTDELHKLFDQARDASRQFGQSSADESLRKHDRGAHKNHESSHLDFGHPADLYGDKNIEQAAAELKSAEKNFNPVKGGETDRVVARQDGAGESSTDANLRAQHDKLEQQARAKMTAPEFEKFQADMKSFETRMTTMEDQFRRGGDTAEAAHKRATEEIRKTYEQTGRLLEGSGDSATGVTAEQRKELAKQIVTNAAQPTSIDQGQHNTCNVNTVEVRAFSRTPGAAAKVIADCAIDGSFTTTDGHKITIDKDSLQPDQEGSKIPTPDGARNYASQIFQVAAVNAYYQPETNGKTRYGIEKPDPTAKPPREGGDYLMDYSSNPPKRLEPGVLDRFGRWVRGEKGEFAGSPQLNADKIQTAGERITGDKSKWILTDSDVRSEEDFNKQLADAKARGNLPMVIQVHTGNEPFYTDSGAGQAGGSGGWHVVTVQDYQPGPPAKVKIDNSWGSDADHNTDANSISVHDMYAAMKSPGAAMDQLQKDVDWNRAHGIVDDYKEVDLLRLMHDKGKISGAEYEQALIERMQEIKKHKDAGTADPQNEERALAKMSSLIHNLPDGRNLALRNEEHRLGLTDDNMHGEYVVYEFAKIADDRRASIAENKYDAAAELSWADSVKTLKATLDSMPADRRNRIVEALKNNNFFEPKAA